MKRTQFITIYKDFLVKTWYNIKLNVDFYVNSTVTVPNSSFFNENSRNLKEYDKNSLENEIILFEADEFIDELSKYWNIRKILYPNLFKLTRIILC
jgi:hypothetical protein